MIDWNSLQRYQQALTLWQWTFVIVIISIAIWMIVWLRSYFREDADDADETLEMLTQFRELHQEGGLSDDEFRLIRSRLTKIARQALVPGQTTPEGSSGLPVRKEPTELSDAESKDSVVQHAIEGKDGKSEGMSDEKTG